MSDQHYKNQVAARLQRDNAPGKVEKLFDLWRYPRRNSNFTRQDVIEFGLLVMELLYQERDDLSHEVHHLKNRLQVTSNILATKIAESNARQGHINTHKDRMSDLVEALRVTLNMEMDKLKARVCERTSEHVL